jgi:hypothetical protein
MSSSGVSSRLSSRVPFHSTTVGWPASAAMPSVRSSRAP